MSNKTILPSYPTITFQFYGLTGYFRLTIIFPVQPVAEWVNPAVAGLFAGVVELADTRDLKSLGAYTPCRFKSGLRHILYPVRVYSSVKETLNWIHPLYFINKIINKPIPVSNENAFSLSVVIRPSFGVYFLMKSSL
jgi:hypothetical protein